jgi:hypothetical protein
MKFRFSILLAAVFASLASLHAQEKEKSKKTEPAAPQVLVSQPGASQPDGLLKPLEKPAPVPANVPDGIAQLVAAFFASLEKGEVDTAYATLTKGSKIAEKPEELKQLKSKTLEAIDVFGAISGYDLVESKSVGSRLVRSTFASHGKVYPLRWRFYFYKPEDVWRLIDMRVDDKLSGMFDESEEPKSAEAKP